MFFFHRHLRDLEKCFLKSSLEMSYSDDKGLHVIAKHNLKSQDLNYIVERHVAEKKVTENYFRLKFYLYKESRTCQTKEPVWDGPLRFLRYACEKHSTFRIFLEQNSKNRNRYDAYLEIVKSTVKTKQELTIYHEDCRDQCALCNKANNNNVLP